MIVLECGASNPTVWRICFMLRSLPSRGGPLALKPAQAILGLSERRIGEAGGLLEGHRASVDASEVGTEEVVTIAAVSTRRFSQDCVGKHTKFTEILHCQND
jgi:hypothetical protein